MVFSFRTIPLPKEAPVAINAQKKMAAKPNTVQTLQSSLGIRGPSKKSGNGAGRQTLQESLGISGGRRTATPIGRNHLRKAMEL